MCNQWQLQDYSGFSANAGVPHEQLFLCGCFIVDTNLFMHEFKIHFSVEVFLLR